MQRKDVKAEYTWKLTDIVGSDGEWEKRADALFAEINLSKYAGKLSDKGTLLKYLRESDELSIEFEKLAVYANLKRDEDTRLTKYNAYNGKIDMIYSKFATETAFFEPELAATDEVLLRQ